MRLSSLIIAASLMAYATPVMAQGVEVHDHTKQKRAPIQVGTVTEAKVTGFTPTTGPVGTVVTITGASFGQRTLVKVGGRPVRIDSYSATAITFRVPNNFYDGTITLQHPGMGNEIPVGTFQVQVDPKIRQFNPRSGPIGTRVELNGEGFLNGDQIIFNGRPLPIAEFGPNRVVVTIPQGASTDFFTVTRPSTRYSWSSKQRFDVSLPAPTVSALTPTQGGPGTQVRITGAYFAPEDRVFYGQGQPVTVVARADAFIDVQVPPNARQSNAFTIRGPRGTVQTPVFVLVLDPTIARFQPEYGGPGTNVDIYGTNFAQGDQVYMNGHPLRRVAYDESKLTVEIAPGASTDRFAIWRNGQAIATASRPFEVRQAPTISGFQPTQGPAGTRVVISGTGFGRDTRVSYGAQQLQVRGDRRRNENQIEVEIPRGAQSQPFTVSTRGGSVNSASAFQVIEYSNLLSISPTSGPVGTRVTINVQGGRADEGFWLGNVSLPIVERGPGRYVVQIAAGAATGKIEWATYGQRQVSNHTFTVVKEMSIERFEPTSGLPNARVTIYGAEFSPKANVYFAGQGWPVVRRNATSIQFFVPLGAAPGRDYLEVRDNGVTVRSAQQFEVLSPGVPTLSPTTGPVGTHVVLSNIAPTPNTRVTLGHDAMTIVSRNATSIEFIATGTPGTQPLYLSEGNNRTQVTAGFTIIGAPKPSAPPPPPPPGPTAPPPPPPAACSLVATPGDVAAGQTVTVDVTNCNVTSVKQAWFKGQPAQIVSVSPTAVVVRLPPKATGSDHVTIETNNGQGVAVRQRSSNKIDVRGY